MARAKPSEPIECLFSNHLWVPTRIVFLYGEVNTEAAAKLDMALTVLAATPEPIEIRLNSAGGNSIDGLAIYDAVSKLSNHVTIKVLGEASSMGSVILQAADTRIAYPHTVFMLHDGSESAPDMHVRDFERRAEESKRSREELYDIYAARSGKSKAHFRRRLGRDWYLTATEALKEGLIDGIA